MDITSATSIYSVYCMSAGILTSEVPTTAASFPGTQPTIYSYGPITSVTLLVTQPAVTRVLVASPTSGASDGKRSRIGVIQNWNIWLSITAPIALSTTLMFIV